MKKQSGFSLIELMVVVAIIGFLSAIGMAVYADVQAKGRDAKRKADIDSLAKVLEIHKTDSGGYFPLQATWFGSSAGVPTVDPKGWNYCLAANSTNTAISNATTSNWVTTGATKGTCTGGDYANGNITLTSGNASIPVANTTTWKVCTLLDDESTVYCRYNVQ